MARARFIRPEFFTDEKVSDLPFGAALLFAGIWCHADLRGVFEHSPRVLRGLIFPMRDGIETATVGEWLTVLERSGMFCRFEAEGKTWGAVTNWSRHQEVTTREVEIGSRRPIPPGWIDPVRWIEIVAKARVSGRITEHSPWNSSGTVLEQTRNHTPTTTTTTTEGESARTRTGFDEIAEKFGLRTSRQGEDLTPEWRAMLKGLKRAQVEQILTEAKPGILWPSEFKAHRQARGV